MPNVIESQTSDGGLGRAAARVSAGVAPSSRKLKRAGLSLGELAERFDCTVQGDADIRLTHVSTLEDADDQAITFVANARYLPILARTQAGAVILSPQYAGQSPIPALIARNPYATYAHRIGPSSCAGRAAWSASDIGDRPWCSPRSGRFSGTRLRDRGGRLAGH